ncbi:MAG: hypothetical protein ABI323_09920, partial [Solirubrobacteraceae bacterium]
MPANHIHPTLTTGGPTNWSGQLATIQQTTARPYRAYPAQRALRQIHRLPAAAAERLLDRWLAWAG